MPDSNEIATVSLSGSIMEDDTIKAGTFIIFETGYYSDSCWYGPFRVMKTFSKSHVAEEFIANGPKEERYRREATVMPDGFWPWLCLNGYIEDVESSTAWHVGEWGEFKP